MSKSAIQESSSLDLQTKAKLLLLKKRPSKSITKNFYLIVYLLYYRYKVELGISVLTVPETIFVNIIISFLIFAIWNQGIRFLFNISISMYKFLMCAYWAYLNMDNYKDLYSSRI